MNDKYHKYDIYRKALSDFKALIWINFCLLKLLLLIVQLSSTVH